MTPAPSFARTTYAQAQREGRDWPNLREGDEGTIVDLSADSDDADMTLTSSTDEASLLAVVRSAARTADLPRTDFLSRQGTVMASADAEFNDYLVRTERDTRFTFPLARLLAALKAAKVPRPLVVAIDKEGREATLVGPRGRRELTQATTLFTPDELAGYDTLETRFHVEPWATLAALALFGLPLLAVLALPIALCRMIGKKSPPAPTTPEEAQAAYDAEAAKPGWRKANLPIYLPLVLMLPLMAAGKNSALSAQAGAALPKAVKNAISTPSAIVWALIVPLVLMAPVFVVSARRRKEAGVPPRPKGEPSPMGFMWPFAVALPLMLAFLVFSKTRPDLVRTFPSEFVRPALLGLPLIAGAASFFVQWRRGRKASRTLPADDPVAAVARELGRQAGVRVRRVVERKEGGANAFASLFGTVGVTAKLRETLDEEETRAVLAHEIGHLKASDPWRFLGLSLPPMLALYALWYWVDFRTPYGDVPLVRFAMQMFFVLGLPALSAWALSPRRRRAEFAADRFAVEQTGEVETVARALTKIHDANLSPHRLHPRDERLAFHPALEKRLARLREAGRADGEP